MVKTKIALVKPFLRDCCFEEAGQCITHATRSECTFRLDPPFPPIGPPSPTPSYSPPLLPPNGQQCILASIPNSNNRRALYPLLEPRIGPSIPLSPLIPSQLVISAYLYPSQTQIIRERMKMRMTIVTITIMTMTIFEDDNNEDGNNDDYNDNENDDKDDDD